MSVMPTDTKLTPSYDEKVVDVSSEEEHYSPAPVDPALAEEERALVRSLDSRILPIACLLYLFACELSDFFVMTMALTLLYFQTLTVLISATRDFKGSTRTS